MNRQDQVLHVWGEMACFTRPEMKAERFSYPVITPSAARGIYDAIYCKPIEFRWQITEIEILKPISWIALRRNEVKDVSSTDIVEKWMGGRSQPQPLMADGGNQRTQRQTMALSDVAYRLHAYIVPWPAFEGHLVALQEQFRRRASQGKCFFQPSFGCREFPAYFELGAENGGSPVPVDLEIGPMVYDVFDLSKPNENCVRPRISIFRAQVQQGRMPVPEWNDATVYKSPLEANHAAPHR